jgi:hypothetical protein
MATTVVNLRHEPFDIYIGRGSKWGNPFRIGNHRTGTRQAVIARYRAFLMAPEQKWLMDSLHELKGRRLGCYCAPEACHGHVLAELADAPPGQFGLNGIWECGSEPPHGAAPHRIAFLFADGTQTVGRRVVPRYEKRSLPSIQEELFALMEVGSQIASTEVIHDHAIGWKLIA